MALEYTAAEEEARRAAAAGEGGKRVAGSAAYLLQCWAFMNLLGGNCKENMWPAVLFGCTPYLLE